MKKIAIVTNKMIMGGIEKSLINFLKVLKSNDCEITVYLCELGGELYSQIPEDVQVRDVFQDAHSTEDIIKSIIKFKQIKNAKKICYSIMNRLDKNTFRIWERSLEFCSIDYEAYDVAIAYGSPVSFATTCVAKHISANRKFVWIHNEIDKTGFEKRELAHYYDAFDTIYCVSKKCRTIFVDFLPQYKEKAKVFYNYINSDEVYNLAEKAPGFMDGFLGIKILTVGRVCDQKGQDIIPSIVKILWDDGINTRWYCIGEGVEKTKEVQNQAVALGVGEGIVFLGNQNNPYPYFKDCDIYVQPSRHEGFGLTISEAKLFKKPILLTDFAGCDEQIKNGVDGIVVEFDARKIAVEIKKVIADKELRDRIATAAYHSGIKCVSDIREVLGELE